MDDAHSARCTDAKTDTRPDPNAHPRSQRRRLALHSSCDRGALLHSWRNARPFAEKTQSQQEATERLACRRPKGTAICRCGSSAEASDAHTQLRRMRTISRLSCAMQSMLVFALPSLPRRVRRVSEKRVYPNVCKLICSRTRLCCCCTSHAKHMQLQTLACSNRHQTIGRRRNARDERLGVRVAQQW